MPLQRADIAATLLSTTRARHEVVDFTVPLFVVYITVLYKKSIARDISSLEELVVVPDMIFLVVRFTSNEKFVKESNLGIVQKINKRLQVCDTDHRDGSLGTRAMYIDGALTRMESICFAYVVFIITKS